MESIIYFVSIFSEEILLFLGLFIGVTSSAYFIYLIMKKRRYGLFHKNSSAFVVKEYLNEVIGETEEIRNQLFGILSGEDPSLHRRAPREPVLSVSTQETAPTAATSASAAPAAAPQAAPVDHEKLKQLEKNVQDLNTKAAQLEKEKKELEEKLKTQPKPAAEAAGGGSNTELENKVKGLEDRLAEYSVIEDDLANLKKLQQENAQLKAALEGKGGSLPPPEQAEAAALAPEAESPAPANPEPEKTEAVVAADATPDPAPTPTPPVPEEGKTPEFEELVDNVEKSLEGEVVPPVENAPAPQEAKKETAPEMTPEAADKPAKEDEDLLKEFERMLNV